MDAQNKHCYLQRFTACFYTQIETNSTQYPTIIPFTPICLTYSFWSVKPAAYGFWLLVVPFLYHSVIPLNFATSCLHNHNADVPCTDIAIGCRAQQRRPGRAFHEPTYRMLQLYAECTNAEGLARSTIAAPQAAEFQPASRILKCSHKTAEKKLRLAEKPPKKNRLLAAEINLVVNFSACCV